jgi:glycosyltransferase involved in cell wall biosynthesis
MNNAPLVSVIITTKNEERNIGNCLKSVKEQSYPASALEAIVMDNHSTDDTVKIAKNFTEKIYLKGPERAAQRNYGAQKAKGKYILYLDADMILSKEVVTECVAKCEDEDYIALYVPENIIGDGFWIKVRDFERSFYNASCVDAVRFIKKDKFLKVKGFDEEKLASGPEDWDFDRRIKQLGNTSIIKYPLYHNEGEFAINNYLSKKGYYSKALDGYVKKWGKDDPIIKKQLGVCYRLFRVFIENGKWKRLMRHPLLTAGMYFLRFRVALTYLKSQNT